MSVSAHEHSQRDLCNHSLFKIAPDLTQIESPADIGYHPDSLLSVLDFFSVYPRHMASSGIRGEDFVAIRYAPIDDPKQIKVICVYLRYVNGAWALRKEAKPVTDEEFARFTQLAQHQKISIDGQWYQRV